MKTCPKCKTDKPFSDFHKDKTRSDDVQCYCKDCSSKRSKESYDPLKRKVLDLKKNYGLSWDEYIDLYDKQNGKCLGCERKIFIEINSDTPAVVDHNHKNGKVRGLLCRDCNLILGNAFDNIETLKNLIKYLEKSK